MHVKALTIGANEVIVVLHTLGKTLPVFRQYGIDPFRHTVKLHSEIKLAIVKAFDGLAKGTTHLLEFLQHLTVRSSM